MAKLKMVCKSEIGQFTVTEAGEYAWRRIMNNKSADNYWVFDYLKVGDTIEGQFEGCGPITWEVE